MKTKKAFTLVELLVVISIIALLLAILMPALGRVKDKAKQVVCASRLHSIGNAIFLYASQNNDSLLPFGAGAQNATSEMPLHFMYYLIPHHSSPYAGFSGLGYLYAAGIIDMNSDTIFCPSVKSQSSGSNYAKRMNSNGDSTHWNYVGPEGDQGRRLLPSDSGFSWVNLRSNYGVRAITLELGQTGSTSWTASTMLSKIRGRKAYLSDWWAATYWYQSAVDSLPHEDTLNTWFTDGSVSGHKINTKVLFDDQGKMKRGTTWKVIYENGN